MILTVILVFVLAAFVVTIVSAMGKCPLWIAVMCLCAVELLHVLPVGK